jgi:hypothetical protein
MTHEQIAERLTELPVDLCVYCLILNEDGDAGNGHEFLPDWSGWLFAGVDCGGDDVDDLRCQGHFGKFTCGGCGSRLAGDRYCHVAIKP